MQVYICTCACQGVRASAGAVAGASGGTGRGAGGGTGGGAGTPPSYCATAAEPHHLDRNGARPPLEIRQAVTSLAFQYRIG